MNVPVWAYVLGLITVLAGSFFGSFALMKNNGRTTHSTEEMALSKGQREFIESLQKTASSYQEILGKFADEVNEKIAAQREAAETKALLAKLETKMSEIEAQMAKMVAEQDNLNLKAACVPMLESQLADRDKKINAQALTIEEMGKKLDNSRAMLETAGRAQERLEGAKSEAEKLFESKAFDAVNPKTVDYSQGREGGEGR